MDRKWWVLNYICVYSITFLLPFYLIQGRGLNPAQAGAIFTTQLAQNTSDPLYRGISLGILAAAGVAL